MGRRPGGGGGGEREVARLCVYVWAFVCVCVGGCTHMQVWMGGGGEERVRYVMC